MKETVSHKRISVFFQTGCYYSVLWSVESYYFHKLTFLLRFWNCVNFWATLCCTIVHFSLCASSIYIANNYCAKSAITELLTFCHHLKLTTKCLGYISLLRIRKINLWHQRHGRPSGLWRSDTTANNHCHGVFLSPCDQNDFRVISQVMFQKDSAGFMSRKAGRNAHCASWFQTFGPKKSLNLSAEADLVFQCLALFYCKAKRPSAAVSHTHT